MRAHGDDERRDNKRERLRGSHQPHSSQDRRGSLRHDRHRNRHTIAVSLFNCQSTFVSFNLAFTMRAPHVPR